MTTEEKKQKCRDILEKGMDALTCKTANLSWFDWEKFNEDLTAALEELEE